MPVRPPVRVVENRARAPLGAPYPAALRAILSHAAAARARRTIAAWPGYAPTPLHALPDLARAASVARIWYKDENERFGLRSFKALGGAYAVDALLAHERERAPAAFTVTCATAGNHGRSVAWGARRAGARCVLYLHAAVSAEREAALRELGAEIVRTPGTYDDAVRRAARDAAAHGWQVVSDTAYPGYDRVPRDVMQGYTVLVDELLEQLPPGERPTHVFAQCGVGGLATALCAHLWEAWPGARPRTVLVEPEHAACFAESFARGEPSALSGPLDTALTCLACAVPSDLAWEVLRQGADAALAIDDETAFAAMRALARAGPERPALEAGESGAAGLAGALSAAHDPAARARLGLDASARVLVVGSEGPNDRALYHRVTQAAPSEPRA
jgi:diaminopropionate ammonia-lyase